MSEALVTGEETGVSAVNPKGEVMVFLDRPVANYSHFQVDGNRVILTGRGAERHSRVYGRTCIAALAHTRSLILLQVSEGGEPENSVILRKKGD